MTKNKSGKATREILSILDTELKCRRNPPRGCFGSMAEWPLHLGVFCVIVEAGDCCSYCSSDSLIDSSFSSFGFLIQQKKYFLINFLKLFSTLEDFFSSSISTLDNGIMSIDSIRFRLPRRLRVEVVDEKKYETSSSSDPDSDDESSRKLK